jgi:hypothetical protein
LGHKVADYRDLERSELQHWLPIIGAVITIAAVAAFVAAVSAVVAAVIAAVATIGVTGVGGSGDLWDGFWGQLNGHLTVGKAGAEQMEHIGQHTSSS